MILSSVPICSVPFCSYILIRDQQITLSEFSIGYFSTIHNFTAHNDILKYIEFESKTLESFFRKYFSQILFENVNIRSIH